MDTSIVVLDDDTDDLELTGDALKQLGISHRICLCKTWHEMVAELKKESAVPLLVLCDFNMPGRNGFEVREEMLKDEKLRYRSVPFIFWSTAASEQQIRRAYDNLAQGVFLKPNSMSALKELLALLIKYWENSQQPKKT